MPDINPPVNLDDYAEIIDNNPHEDGENWGLPCYNRLKAFVKEHYSILQEDVCFYCKINLRHGGYGEPIEHIVPKSDKPQWMFKPRNLALSCFPCNTKKNADNTLSLAGLGSINYPDTTDGFAIYHPHYDNWVDHMEQFYEFFLKPISDKGRETFKVCELYRLNLPLDKAKQKSWKEEPFRTKIIEQVLIDPTTSEELLKQCKRISKEIIRRGKIKKEILDVMKYPSSN
jgi:uncharacterized protein (TIGR02646 family)